jgi:hypothetical protein
VVVTGNALTIKYDTNGNQLWIAPYDGNEIAIDAGGNSIVTGYGSGFNTVKLNPSGSNLWSQSYVSSWGPAVSQAVVVDGGGNAYVAGSDTYICYQEGAFRDCYSGLLTVKYDPSGNQLWINIPSGGFAPPQVVGIALDSKSNVYVIENGYLQNGLSFAYSADGSFLWKSGPIYNMTSSGGLIVDALSRMMIVGTAVPSANNYPNTSLTTVKLDTNGTPLWTNYFPLSPAASSGGDSIALDQSNGIYVTGYSPGTNGTNNIVTIKCGSTGNRIWGQQYNGLNSGNDAGNAIAVDKNGNVYVTGYETLPGGGTGIVTIKYSPVVLQRHADGTVLLETQGSPGESFDIEASIDLLNWLDLGTVLADTNGLMQFDDTNAPSFPSRFYYTNPQ